MKKFETLAPVGGTEQLKAAVICGADAVYLGTSAFNARRNAENFTAENLTEIVKYCHLRKVKVYVTLNILIFDKELHDLYETVKEIARAGADAVIVQDLATYRAVKDICPELSIHASTQMAVHNVSGAVTLEKMGFERIVLARELSLEEIKEIRSAVNAELEVFVHGAHCMSASGNCYLSAMLGERSGNRGLCAQGCRLNWVSSSGREYALSLKDMSYLDYIDELQKIGVDSFKIEGRMKRPEYVAAAVTALNNAKQGRSYNKEQLRSVFSRSGFTSGYLTGNRDISMFGFRNKDDVTSASTVLKSLEALYQKDIHPLIADAELTIEKNSPTTLTFSCNGKSVTVTGELPQEPRTAPLSEEIARRNISKLGDTPFTLGNLVFNNPNSLTLPASAINALRRNCCESLEDALTQCPYEINIDAKPDNISKSADKKSKIIVRLQSFSQYSRDLNKADLIILPLEEILGNSDEIQSIAAHFAVELPSLIYPNKEPFILKSLSEIKKMGINHGFTGNIGGIYLLREAGFKIHGNHGLNITNSISACEYKKLGLTDITLSFELTGTAAENITADIPTGVYVYGHLPLMLLRACPQKTPEGCKGCTGKTFLTDRKGIQFPLLCHEKEYSTLLNSVPLYTGDKAIPNYISKTLYFTIENADRCKEIFNAVLNGREINGKKTNGLYKRELL